MNVPDTESSLENIPAKSFSKLIWGQFHKKILIGSKKLNL